MTTTSTSNIAPAQARAVFNSIPLQANAVIETPVKTIQLNDDACREVISRLSMARGIVTVKFSVEQLGAYPETIQVFRKELSSLNAAIEQMWGVA